ncbi:MAG TPA: NAD(P)-dependent oxidoreductase [Candidatus Syntrophosphaera sp.]|jgi:D-3-phosphoglycerate dehydrogenase|nr:NAD(P)-dependent oxidoreductase [Candidatus Cloacimonadota bacterium]OQB90527.1 MAG: D-3-phosphoglycerate dehydrogenase [Candidatus Cloacimonetes bacterium ADurb.Bin117]HNU54708.1 NAD(P)-dependent oxidoreductase [Candidatus Syntrophosphaera sp.]NLH93127.1 3-phosphoglycerate dehydrogenase [Candidatus Cloacimonadota bacterium]HOH49059.1 NAD(P)-dependent oxidoreductase [Candidatus Syntrophosphaera sp.]
MPKVLIATEKPFAAAAVQKIKAELDAAGYTHAWLENYTDPKDLHTAVADADALIIRSDKVDEAVFAAAPKLKIVVRAGAGYDNIDLAAATAHNVVAMNTPGQNSNAVAELALAMMIYMARGKFNGKSGSELAGKKLVLYGFGFVPRFLAKMAKGVGMEVFAYDPYISPEIMAKEGVTTLNSVQEIFSTGDYISLHIPATAETKKSINWDLLSLMKDNCIMVNTARKEVIDEDSLLKAFEEKAKFRYVSDVEPDCSAKLAELYPDRSYWTPKKMGAQTGEANVNAGVAAAKQIIAFLEKGDTTFKVN